MTSRLGSFVATVVLASACGAWAREGLDVATLPPEVQPDYALFAQRCSKCHSLARPLTSGIDEDAYWVDYVARMRRQPGSGISEGDTVGILRFLHYFSLEERRKKHPAEAAPGHADVPASAPPPAGSAPPPPPPPAVPTASPPTALGPVPGLLAGRGAR